jgi:hypothetical protein
MSSNSESSPKKEKNTFFFIQAIQQHLKHMNMGFGDIRDWMDK